MYTIHPFLNALYLYNYNDCVKTIYEFSGNIKCIQLYTKDQNYDKINSLNGLYFNAFIASELFKSNSPYSNVIKKCSINIISRFDFGNTRLKSDKYLLHDICKGKTMQLDKIEFLITDGYLFDMLDDNKKTPLSYRRECEMETIEKHFDDNICNICYSIRDIQQKLCCCKTMKYCLDCILKLNNQCGVCNNILINCDRYHHLYNRVKIRSRYIDDSDTYTYIQPRYMSTHLHLNNYRYRRHTNFSTEPVEGHTSSGFGQSNTFGDMWASLNRMEYMWDGMEHTIGGIRGNYRSEDYQIRVGDTITGRVGERNNDSTHQNPAMRIFENRLRDHRWARSIGTNLLADGVRPDIILNPSSIPTRMSSQDWELLIGNIERRNREDLEIHQRHIQEIENNTSLENIVRQNNLSQQRVRRQRERDQMSRRNILQQNISQRAAFGNRNRR